MASLVLPVVAPATLEPAIYALPSVLGARKKQAEVRQRIGEKLEERFPGALTLVARGDAEKLSTGCAELDSLVEGGVPRGELSEITGAASSGRTSLMFSLLAQVTMRQEACALVDAGNAFHPESAAQAGVDLRRLLWVRCGAGASPGRLARAGSRKPDESFSRLEQMLKVADLLLQAGGFGVVALDMGDIPTAAARRVPLASWFRFRRAVRGTHAALVLVEQESCAQSCASLVIKLHEKKSPQSFQHHSFLFRPDCGVTHGRILRGLAAHAEVARARMSRQPGTGATASFHLQAFAPEAA